MKGVAEASKADVGETWSCSLKNQHRAIRLQLPEHIALWKVLTLTLTLVSQALKESWRVSQPGLRTLCPSLAE